MTQPQSFPPWKPPEPDDRAFRPAVRQQFKPVGSAQQLDQTAADLEFLNDIDNLNNDWPDYQEFRNDCLALPGEPFGTEAQMLLTPWREDEPMAGEQAPKPATDERTSEQGEQLQQQQQSHRPTESRPPMGQAADLQQATQQQALGGEDKALAMPEQGGQPAVELMQLMGGSADPVAALHEQYQGIVAQQQALLVKFHQLETAKHTLLRSHNLPLPPAHPPEALEAMATAAQPLPRDMFGALLPLLAAQQVQRQQQQQQQQAQQEDRSAQPKEGDRLPNPMEQQQQQQSGQQEQQQLRHDQVRLPDMQEGMQGQRQSVRQDRQVQPQQPQTSAGTQQRQKQEQEQQQMLQRQQSGVQEQQAVADADADAAKQPAGNAAPAAAAASKIGPFGSNTLMANFTPQALASMQFNPMMAAAAAAVAAAAGMGPQAAAVPGLLDWLIAAGQPQQNWMGGPGGMPGNGDAAAQMANMAVAAAAGAGGPPAGNLTSQGSDVQRTLGKRRSDSMDFAQAHHAKLGRCGSHGSTSTAVPPGAAGIMGPGQLDPAAMLALANASTMHTFAGGSLPPLPGGFSLTGSCDSAMDCTSFLPPAYLAAAAQAGLVQQPQGSQQRSQATVGNAMDKSSVLPSDVASSGAGCGGGATPSRHGSGSMERERSNSGGASRAGKGSTRGDAAQKGSAAASTGPPGVPAQTPRASNVGSTEAVVGSTQADLPMPHATQQPQQAKDAGTPSHPARAAAEAGSGPASSSMPPPPRQPQQAHQQDLEQQQQQAADDKQFAAALDAANAAIAALERSNSHALASTRAGVPGNLAPEAEAQQQAMLSSIQQMAAAANLGLGAPGMPGLLPPHMWQQSMPVPPQALLDPMQWQQAMQWQNNLASGAGPGMPSMGTGSMGTGPGGSLTAGGGGSMGLAPSSSLGTALGGSVGAVPPGLQMPFRPQLTEAERQLLLRTRHAVGQLPQPVRVQLQEHFSGMAHSGSEGSRGFGSRGSVVAHVREVVQHALQGAHVQQQAPDAVPHVAELGAEDAAVAAGCMEQKPAVAG